MEAGSGRARRTQSGAVYPLEGPLCPTVGVVHIFKSKDGLLLLDGFTPISFHVEDSAQLQVSQRLFPGRRFRIINALTKLLLSRTSYNRILRLGSSPRPRGKPYYLYDYLFHYTSNQFIYLLLPP